MIGIVSDVLVNAGLALVTGVSVARVGATELALGLTAACMVWLKLAHSPAGATTLIMSLGILTNINQMDILMLEVLRNASKR